MPKLETIEDDIVIDILEGIVLHARPVSFLGVTKARHRAEKLMAELEGGVKTIEDIGGEVDIQIDLNDKIERDALAHTIFVIEIAKDHIISWKNIVGPDDKALDPTPENIENLFKIPNFMIAEIFWAKIMKSHMEYLSSKKELAIVPSGMQRQGAVADIVTDVKNKIFPVQEGMQGKMENVAPT